MSMYESAACLLARINQVIMFESIVYLCSQNKSINNASVFSYTVEVDAYKLGSRWQGQHMGSRSGFRSRSLTGLCSRFRANLMVLGSSLEAQYQRFSCHIQVNRHTIQLIFTIVFALIFFGKHFTLAQYSLNCYLSFLNI